MKKALSVLLVLVFCFTLIAPAQVSAAVKISKAKATMEKDSTLKLGIAGTTSTVSWKTNKKSVATVDKTGLVKAIGEGTAVITATISSAKYTCTVKVVDSNKAPVEKIYGIGDTWTVDGLWTLTFVSATPTDYRNMFSDETPGQVVVLDYTYENLGYTDFTDLYISSMNFKVVDGSDEVSNIYPATINDPQETPIGAKCVGAQQAYGLNNESSTITVYVEIYDMNYNKHKATFKLKVE